jgi:uncharacterized protein YndB with AHSA1/START domain
MTSKTNFNVDREKLEVTTSRVFDAPTQLVWRVFTDPKFIPEWWGPRFLKTTVDRMEFRVGGSWRFIHEDLRETKRKYGFNGEYREIDVGKRIVSTFVFEDFPENVMVETSIFESLPGGNTKLTQVSKFPSVEALDGMVGTGMEMGRTQSHDRLEELLRRQGK